jgi:Na+-transporting methylmalonyl-CoA/oxaloacetate decarboxylase gamma subunit
MFAHGMMISIVSLFVVFIGMLLLVFFINVMMELSIRRTRKRVVKSSGEELNREDIKIPADISVAIGMALYLNKFLAGNEQHRITIHKSTIPFSPWVTKGRNNMVSTVTSMFGRKK